MDDSRIINVGGCKVGLRGLDQALDELAASQAQDISDAASDAASDAQVGQALLERLRTDNYIPDAARAEYVRALAREFRRHLGQPFAVPAGAGLEVKVLGQGCARCESLTSLVMKVLSELGLPAEVEHLKDIKDIARYGVMGVPGLVINGQVVSTGVVPSAAQVRRWLDEAVGQSREGSHGA